MNDMHAISVRNTFIDFVPEAAVSSRRRCKSESDVLRFGLCAPDCAQLGDLDDVATSDCCTSPRSIASSSWTSDEDSEPLEAWTWAPHGESWEEEDYAAANVVELNLAGMLQCPEAEVDAWVRTGVTTVILRNIPNKYSLQQLLQEVVDRSCAQSLDFAYLPKDTSSQVRWSTLLPRTKNTRLRLTKDTVSSISAMHSLLWLSVKLSTASLSDSFDRAR